MRLTKWVVLLSGVIGICSLFAPMFKLQAFRYDAGFTFIDAAKGLYYLSFASGASRGGPISTSDKEALIGFFSIVSPLFLINAIAFHSFASRSFSRSKAFFTGIVGVALSIVSLFIMMIGDMLISFIVSVGGNAFKDMGLDLSNRVEAGIGSGLVLLLVAGLLAAFGALLGLIKPERAVSQVPPP